MIRLLAFVFVTVLAAQQSAGPAPDPDLYRIELLPAADVASGSGSAELLAPSSPFGVAVTPAGEHLYDVRFELRDLPAPSTFGRYNAYVAWATTPQLHPAIKLGEVKNGTTTLGRIAFD